MCKIGLVLEGGACRGIFTAGVLDYLLEREISFPYVIGVSSGSGNASGFVSKQSGKFKDIVLKKSDSYCGLAQLRSSKKLLDTDSMVYTYFYKQPLFDFDTFYSSPAECEFVVTCCETGRAEYRDAKNSEEGLPTLTKASCSVPFLCRPVQMGDLHYLDGSLADSVPAKYALENKCDKVVVIMTRKWEDEPPTDYSKLGPAINIGYRKQYPNLADTLMKRRENYEKAMECLSEYERQGAAYIIRPESMGIKHFEKDANKVNAYYNHGRTVMENHMSELCKFMKA
ncbi:MAG: patatin family protein [Firmicutes bacterium]|nr:patatin family protein [Bacillota bacterium]